MPLSRRTVLAAGVAGLAVLPWWTGAFACARTGPVVDLRGSGAVGDGRTDDSAPVREAIAQAPAGATITLSGGSYLVGDVGLKSDLVIRGPGTFVFREGARHMFAANPGAGGTPEPADNLHDIVFDRVTFRGRSCQGFDEFSHLLFLSAVSDVTIRSCAFNAFQGDAIMLASSEMRDTERHNERIRVVDCSFDGTNGQNRNAISVIDVRLLTIQGCTFTRCSRPDMPGPIDFEPNAWNSSAVLADIDVSRNRFTANTGENGDVTMSLVPFRLDRPPRNVRIHHNHFESTTVSVGVRWKDHAGHPEDPPIDVMVSDNTALGPDARAFCELAGVRGVTIRHNTISDLGGVVLACGTEGEPCADTRLETNTLSSVSGRAGAVIEVGSVRGLSAAANVVRGTAPSTWLRLTAPGSSAELAMIGNDLPDSMVLAERAPGHLTQQSTNAASTNGGASVDPTIFGRG